MAVKKFLKKVCVSGFCPGLSGFQFFPCPGFVYNCIRYLSISQGDVLSLKQRYQFSHRKIGTVLLSGKIGGKSAVVSGYQFPQIIGRSFDIIFMILHIGFKGFDVGLRLFFAESGVSQFVFSGQQDFNKTGVDFQNFLPGRRVVNQFRYQHLPFGVEFVDIGIRRQAD